MRKLNQVEKNGTMNKIIEKFIEWKQKHPNEDYQLDQIYDFVVSLDRGELLEVFETLEKAYKRGENNGN